MGNSGESKFQIALTSSLESDAYALQCIREYQQGKLVLWAWSSRGYSTLEDIAEWHCGGDVDKAAELLAPMEKGVFTEYIKGKELPSLHILGEEKAVQIPDDQFLSGEKIHIWFVDRGEDGNIPLPNWFSLPIELAISMWRKEEQDWEAKKTARSPKPLTANQQKLYDAWLANSTRRIVLDQSQKSQLAHPSSVSKHYLLNHGILLEPSLEISVFPVKHVPKRGFGLQNGDGISIPTLDKVPSHITLEMDNSWILQ